MSVGSIGWCADCNLSTTVADEGVEEDNWGALFWGITFECGHTRALPWCRSCAGYHALGGPHFDPDAPRCTCDVPVEIWTPGCPEHDEAWRL